MLKTRTSTHGRKTPDRNGQTILDYAAERGYEPVLEILRGICDRIASSPLDSDTQADFSNEQLETLKKYVNNESYTEIRKKFYENLKKCVLRDLKI